MWNIRERTDDDYYEMCRSTPVTLPDGYHFETAHCEDRRVRTTLYLDPTMPLIDSYRIGGLVIEEALSESGKYQTIDANDHSNRAYVA